MLNSVRRKYNHSLHQKDNDIKFKIEVATATLDRNISFIVSCDNKASIALTVIGVLVTFILTSNEVNNFYTIVECNSGGIELSKCVYLVLLIIGILCLAIGITKLISVLIATIELNPKDLEKQKKERSRIFFAGISQYENFESYKSEFSEMSQQIVLEELIKEIYINAAIATQKYRKLNIGLKLSILGFITLSLARLLGLQFL
jgi:hypothetical protein